MYFVVFFSVIFWFISRIKSVNRKMCQILIVDRYQGHNFDNIHNFTFSCEFQISNFKFQITDEFAHYAFSEMNSSKLKLIFNTI